jgi:hypothetical protein
MGLTRIGMSFRIFYAGTAQSLSWEPQSGLAGCERILKRFWNHIGMDDEDYEPGAVLKASDEWIG